MNITEHDMFKLKLDQLADEALKKAGKKHPYEKKDLMNSLLVFMEVLCSMGYDNMGKKISLEQSSEIFRQSGKIIHDVVYNLTGINTKE